MNTEKMTMGQMFVGSGEDLDLTPMSQDDLRRQPSRNLIPRFFTETVGGVGGTFVEVDMVEILIPGDSKSGPVHKVTDVIKTRFPLQYKAWKDGNKVALEGTPLELVVGTGSILHHLKSLNIHSAEQLASVADTFLQELGTGGRDIRERARRLIDVKKKAAVIKKEEDRENQIRSLEETVKEQQKQIASLLVSVKKEDSSVASAVGAENVDESVPEGSMRVTGDKPRLRKRRVR